MGGSKWRQQDEGGGEFEEAIKVLIRDSSPPGPGGTFVVVEVTLWSQVCCYPCVLISKPPTWIEH